jgi:DNA-binding CsgD family transcriptional regulator
MRYGGEAPALVGRDDERAALRAFLRVEPADSTDEPAAAMVLLGDAGIGKTALWRAGVQHAAGSGWRVLTAAPTEAEHALTFAGLGDLLSGVGAEELGRLSAPLRLALEVALVRRVPEGPPPDLRVVGLVLASLLDLLAADGPVLIALDDAGWLDESSAAALAFAWRRIGGDQVRVLLTCRRIDDLDMGLAAMAAQARPVRLGPLSLGATQQLLRDGGAEVSHGHVRRVHEIADGNPLHALELLRAGQEHDPAGSLPGAAEFTPPRELADLVRTRLATLPTSTRDLLLTVAALSRPTLDELAALAGGREPVDDIEAAVAAGLLAVDGNRLRFTHPLFASACYRGASQASRRAVHRRLAAVVTDLEERARHLARGVEEADDAVAATLDDAARTARRRGSPTAAAELALLALERTADLDSPAADRRTRDAAAHLTDAGSTARARALLQERIGRYDDDADDDADADARSAERRAEHVLNLTALAAIEYEFGGPTRSRRTSERAVRAAGADPRLLAEALLSLASRSHCTAKERLKHTTEGLRLLAGHGDPDPRVLAGLLREQGLAAYHLGHGLPREQLDRATALEEQFPDPLPITWRARTCLGECLKYVDEFDASTAILTETAALAEAHGDVNALIGTLGHQSELALWLGHWDQADELARRAAQLAVEAEQPGRLPFPLIGQLLVAAHRGEHEAAQTLGAAALAAAREADGGWFEAMAHAAVGFAELTAGRPAAAVVALAQTDASVAHNLITAPRQFRYLVDYVEALVLTGDLDLAADRQAVLEGWADSAPHTRHGWPALMAARARGLVLERRGDRDGALAAIEHAAALGEALPLPFVRARTRLALASALRRSRSKRRARLLFDQAIAGFDALGARSWAQRARDEAARVSGRAPAGDALTVTEARVAALVAQGRSNREVARELVVTPRTVEAHLTRIYAKLGLRSRVELAAHSMGVSPIPSPTARS